MNYDQKPNSDACLYHVMKTSKGLPELLPATNQPSYINMPKCPL